jgi:hypothetical protein
MFGLTRIGLLFSVSLIAYFSDGNIIFHLRRFDLRPFFFRNATMA